MLDAFDSSFKFAFFCRLWNAPSACGWHIPILHCRTQETGPHPEWLQIFVEGCPWMSYTHTYIYIYRNKKRFSFGRSIFWMLFLISISGHAVLSGNRVSAMFQLLRSVHFLSSAISATEPQMVQCEASSVLCPELRSSCLARLKEQATASLNHFIRVGCGHSLNHVEPLYAWMIR